MYMYGWIMEKPRSITFLQAEFVQDYIIHRFLDWNSKTSSFKERGTDVERSHKSRLNQATNQGSNSNSNRPQKPAEDSDRPACRPPGSRG